MHRTLLLVVLAACGPSEGVKGDPGDTGPAGPMGAQGSAGPAGTTGQDVIEGVGTRQIQISGATNFSAIPGLSITGTVPRNAKLHVDTSGGIGLQVRRGRAPLPRGRPARRGGHDQPLGPPDPPVSSARAHGRGAGAPSAR